MPPIDPNNIMRKQKQSKHEREARCLVHAPRTRNDEAAARDRDVCARTRFLYLSRTTPRELCRESTPQQQQQQ